MMPKHIKKFEIAKKMHPFATKKARYKVAWGGRGSSKSWSIARLLLLKGVNECLSILCVREIQKSIDKSVHKLLSEQIKKLGLSKFYTITKNRIIGTNGTEFQFEGLFCNIDNIKSIEGVDICWIEEAATISKKSWEVLTPTIRKEEGEDDEGSVIGNDSEIWISFNPKNEKDIIYKTFVANEPPPNSIVINMNYTDNKWFTKVSDADRKHCQATDTDLYNHTWLGHCEKHSDAQIFKGKWISQNFVTPSSAVFYHGIDWGNSATDPTVLVRCFILNRKLYIDKAKFCYQVDISDLPGLLSRAVPTVYDWAIRADHNERSAFQTCKNAGFKMVIAVKPPGSIKYGIEYLRGFDQIVVHESLTELIEEFTLYKYKVDKRSDEILKEPVDKYNHGMDAIRYSVSKFSRKGHK